jgi:hypothetical protein
MTTQTKVADVLDALLATWQAAPTLTAYGDRLAVFDGPPVTDRAREIELWVGATGEDSDETVIQGSQEFVTFGDAAGDRDEDLDIECAIWVAAGNTDIKTARRTAIDVFNAAAGAIRGSDLGDAALDPTVQVASWRLRQGQFSTGVGVILRFTVHVSGLL